MAANIARLPPRERKEFLARQKGKMLATLTLEQRAKRAADAHDRGNEHFRRQSWAEAAFEYHLSLALMPSSATVGSNLAATMLKMKQFKAALEAADAALKLFGDDKLQYAELSVRKKLIRRRELALSGLQQSTTVMEEPAIETVQAQELAGAQRQNRASLLARGNDADSSETSLSAPV
jgi:lipoprotein NlpI